METQRVQRSVGTLGDKGVGLLKLTTELVVVVSNTLDAVSGGTVAGVAGSLLDMGLFLKSGDDHFTDMA